MIEIIHQKGFESNFPRCDTRLVITTKADNQKRVRVPQARPGQVYTVRENADGGFTLVVVRTAPSASPKCRIVKENGYTVVSPGQPIDEQAIKELLADFP